MPRPGLTSGSKAATQQWLLHFPVSRKPRIEEGDAEDVLPWSTTAGSWKHKLFPKEVAASTAQSRENQLAEQYKASEITKFGTVDEAAMQCFPKPKKKYFLLATAHHRNLQHREPSPHPTLYLTQNAHRKSQNKTSPPPPFRRGQ